MLKLMAYMVAFKIYPPHRSMQSTTHAVMADETTDAIKNSWLSSVAMLRMSCKYMKSCGPLSPAGYTNATTIVTVLKDVLLARSLDNHRLRRQCYIDG